ncbi:MAG: serine/threonine-protein kinase [Myxococcota bacterium]
MSEVEPPRRKEAELGGADTVSDPRLPASVEPVGLVATRPQRSPSQQQLHDDVKGALFSQRPLPVRPEIGKVFAGRYRIEQRLGAGGMGEVFRAHDLVLAEDIALKLLPRELVTRPGYHERFIQEVRLARQVSHPCVCRVHDIGEVDGQPFISMEYVDGEDMAALLRRIGRLGSEKALELSHQLCAGLSALHEQGIVHRDLKPSNIMVDGDGRIRLADFGLASVADELREHEIRDGTPAYQAPEQRAGREATTRSDVYALGLVMRQMFLGGGPLATERSGSKTSAEARLDPGIGEVIARCLEAEPVERPESAAAVSAALPGGDPLVAALAAGRRPSPDAVANARTVGGLSIVRAQVLFVLTLVGLIALAVLHSKRSVLGMSSELLSPPVLEHRVLEVLETLAEEDRGVRTSILSYDDAVLDDLDGHGIRSTEVLADYSAFRFQYRRFGGLAALPLAAEEFPLAAPGDLRVVLDGRGRLLELSRVPAAEPPDPATELPTEPAEWSEFHRQAQLDPSTLVATEPSRVPPIYADEVRAWSGRYGETELRIHAAARLGVPVWFSVERVQSPTEVVEEMTGIKAIAILVVMLTGLVLASVIVRDALSALRGREGDVRGARIVALLTFFIAFADWVLSISLLSTMLFVFWIPFMAGLAMMSWLAYLVLEPYARTHWPRTLVSWNRLLQGRWLDPMVGRDLLIGAFSGVGYALLSYVSTREITAFELESMLSSGAILGVVLSSVPLALGLTFLVYIALLGLHRVFRVRVVAVGIFVGSVPSLLLILDRPSSFVIMGLVVGAGAALIMLRYGMLAMAFSMFVGLMCASLPVSFGFGAWWTSAGLLTTLLIATMAVGGGWLASSPGRVVQARVRSTRT